MYTTILNGVRTLCEKLESINIVGSEKQSVYERYSRVESGQFGSGRAGSIKKNIKWIKISLFNL